jgi:hypothetical protein
MNYEDLGVKLKLQCHHSFMAQPFLIIYYIVGLKTSSSSFLGPNYPHNMLHHGTKACHCILHGLLLVFLLVLCLVHSCRNVVQVTNAFCSRLVCAGDGEAGAREIHAGDGDPDSAAGARPPRVPPAGPPARVQGGPQPRRLLPRQDRALRPRLHDDLRSHVTHVLHLVYVLLLLVVATQLPGVEER